MALVILTEDDIKAVAYTVSDFPAPKYGKSEGVEKPSLIDLIEPSSARNLSLIGLPVSSIPGNKPVQTLKLPSQQESLDFGVT
ncbi:hypothetical protein [Paenibacillus sp. BK720]|uniref:hypothetical protein n=1 Tax=Paenibacillus sp. BK720 TaxID=2587092 RepID=UPI001ABA482C|nr:hypothetical protein [Paenibacillus sp. BK720]